VTSEQRTGQHKAAVEALCLAQGLPPALLPTYSFGLRRVNGVSGGNSRLDAEQADTATFGIVLTSPFDHAALQHLQISLDWYSIDLQDVIGRWDSESAVNRCYDFAYNPGFQANNIYCTFFARNTTTGEIFARIIDSNIGGVDTSGVDLQVDWSMVAGPGRVGASFYLTHVQSWKYSDPSGGTIEYAGTIGGGGVSRALPEWKSLLSLNYEWREARLFARWQYIDGMTDAIYRNDPMYPDFEVPSRNYLDLGASITFSKGTLEGLTARVGVDNATDTEPPVFPSYSQANTDPAVYDVLGRRYYVAVGYSL
jgi:outer membrane receptor protein involved in Fe transport